MPGRGSLIPVKLIRVLLISKRSEVVYFWKKALENVCEFHILPDLSLFMSGTRRNEQNGFAAAIIDTLAIASADEINFFISEKYISLQKVFIIESSLADRKTASEIEKLKLQILPFPCDVRLFKEKAFSLNSDCGITGEKAVTEKLPPELLRFAGTSFSVRSLRKNFYTFGKTDVPLIIQGESGTGKTFAAEIIHSISERRQKGFRRINMPCIQPDIAESELFGSVQGAFTGAVNKKGILQELDGGTAFFDEVAEIPMPVQAKLLKFLDSGCFCKVGSTKESYSDVRIISATNANLEERVQQGLFRRDLYERLKGKIISIPSLNSRKEDIKALVENYLLENNCSHISFSEAAIEALKNHNWTGNVRELETCLELTCSICKKQVIEPEDLIFAG